MSQFISARAGVCFVATLGMFGFAASQHSTRTTTEEGGAIRVESRGPGAWSGRHEPPLKFELEHVYGVEQGSGPSLLGRVTAAAPCDDGSLVVFDGKPLRIVVFDAMGGVRWSAGQVGQGPGELEQVTGVACGESGAVYATNRTGTQVDSWDADGAFNGAYSLQEFGLRYAQLAGVLPGLRVVLYDTLAGRIGAEVLIVELADPPRLVERFTIDQVPGFEMAPRLSELISVRVRGDAILAGSSGAYALREYSSSGVPLRTVARLGVELKLPAWYSQQGRAGMTTLSSLSVPTVLTGGYWLAFVLRSTNSESPEEIARALANAASWRDAPKTVFERTADLFGPAGEFLGSLPLDSIPELGEVLASGPGNTLFTYADEPFPQVRRYRVVLTGQATSN